MNEDAKVDDIGEMFERHCVYNNDDQKRIMEHPELSTTVQGIRDFLRGRDQSAAIPEDLRNRWGLLLHMACGGDMRDVFKCENNRLHHRYGPKGANLLEFGRITLDGSGASPGGPRCGGVLFYLHEVLGRPDLQLFLESSFEETKFEDASHTYLILTEDALKQRQHAQDVAATARAIRDAENREKETCLKEITDRYVAELHAEGFRSRVHYRGQGSSRVLEVRMFKFY